MEDWEDLGSNYYPSPPYEREKKMSRDADALHVWKLKEGSWWLKFYHFWYSPVVEEKSHPNFCKMAWAIIFAIPMIVGWVLIGIAAGLAWPIAKIIEYKHRGTTKYSRMAARETRKEDAKQARRDRRRARKAKATKIPSYLAVKTDATVTFVQTHKKGFRVSGQGILVLFGLGALYGVWMGSWWIIVTLSQNWVWSLFWFVIGGMVAVAIVVAIVIGLVLWADKTGWGRRGLDGVYDHFLTPIGHGFAKVGSSFASFGGFLATAVHAIKTHTCPRIEIIKE